MKSLFTALTMVALLASCASVNSVSLTPIPAQRGNLVKAEVSKTIFLAFNFDNDFIDSVTEKLSSQCPKGMITGILTKDETYNYFLVHKRNVVATGYCSQAVSSQKQALRKRASTEESEL